MNKDDEIEDEDEDEDEEKWECFYCGEEDSFDIMPSAYLGNYHPLCMKCADELIEDIENKHYSRLSYHYLFGDLIFVNKTLFPREYFNNKN